MSDSPRPSESPDHLERDLSYQPRPNAWKRSGLIYDVSSGFFQLPTPSRPSRQESSDNPESLKVSLEDSIWKVLPVALKRYKMDNVDWQNYVMFICHGPPSTSLCNSRICLNNTGCPGKRIERCLSYGEKPLLLFHKLKYASKNPVFMLKHIKDIRSPIASAQLEQRRAFGYLCQPRSSSNG